MARHVTQSLFDDPVEEPAIAGADAPLAERMRPRSLDEFVGQANVIGENTLLGTALRRSGKLSSLILWGPPGTGKTTLAALDRPEQPCQVYRAIRGIGGCARSACGHRRSEEKPAPRCSYHPLH